MMTFSKADLSCAGFVSDGRQARRQVDVQVERGTQRLVEQVLHAQHQGGDVDGLPLQFLAAREGQHALGERGAAARALDGVADEAVDLRVVGKALLDELQTSQDRHQQVVEVVGDTAGELADRLQLLGPEQRLPRQLQRPLRLVPLGDVPGDLRETDHLAILAGDRVDDHVGAKSRAVLAHAPALGLEVALASGHLEAALRGPRGLVFLGVELREMLPDDLFGRVPLDALGAGFQLLTTPSGSSMKIA